MSQSIERTKNNFFQAWPVILAVGTAIAFAASVFADYQAYKARTDEKVTAALAKAEAAEQRFQKIEKYLIRIGAKLGVPELEE